MGRRERGGRMRRKERREGKKDVGERGEGERETRKGE